MKQQCKHAYILLVAADGITSIAASLTDHLRYLTELKLAAHLLH